MQKARGHTGSRHGAPATCRHTVSGSISPPSSGSFSPFPHGTGSLSVVREYLALDDGTPRFPQDSSGPAVLRYVPTSFDLLLQGCHLLWLCFPTDSNSSPNAIWNALQPRKYLYLRFRLFPFRSPLLRESLLISLPEGT